jgi:hypothetical protein
MEKWIEAEGRNPVAAVGVYLRWVKSCWTSDRELQAFSSERGNLSFGLSHWFLYFSKACMIIWVSLPGSLLWRPFFHPVIDNRGPRDGSRATSGAEGEQAWGAGVLLLTSLCLTLPLYSRNDSWEIAQIMLLDSSQTSHRTDMQVFLQFVYQ